MGLILSRSYPDDADEGNREHYWRVTSEGTYVGSIVLHQGRGDEPPVWRWSITVQYPSPGLAKTGDAASREDAMRGFRTGWDAYRAWLGDDLWLEWVRHMDLVNARAGKRR